jgi:Gpi18-like mannosyltransferase
MRYRFLLTALAIFAASRAVVALALVLAYWIIPSPGDWNWSAGDSWFHRLARWDTGWYHEIVVGGYRYSAQRAIGTNAPFFPLFPLFAFLLTAIAGIDGWNSLLIVANVASVAAVLLFAQVCRDELGDETALLAVACFSFFPTSFYLSAGYAEPVCLAFILLSFVTARPPPLHPRRRRRRVRLGCPHHWYLDVARDPCSR